MVKLGIIKIREKELIQMKKFNNLNQAFTWAFNEKEDFAEIKKHFNLSDEIESVADVQLEVSHEVMETYLLDNSFVTKADNGYTFEA